MDNRKYVLYSIKNPFDVESPLSDSVHDLLLNKLEELGCSNYFACFEQFVKYSFSRAYLFAGKTLVNFES